MSNVTHSPTPFGTVVIEAVVPATEIGKFKRSVSATARRKGLGKRISVREHTFGRYTRVGLIYQKAV